ncbi:MAG TPA: hypothetical protein VKG65_10905 [Terriglobales bacterium]|nr:hypothetical protein [Terriglobales bacterium]
MRSLRILTQVNPRIRQALIAVAIVLFAAGSVTGQTRRYPAYPTNTNRVIAGAQAQKSDPKQAEYTFVELDPLGQGVGYCYADAHAINNSDQVVVDWSDPADCNVLHASLWDKGKWALLDYPVDPNCAEPATYLTSLTDWGFAFGTYWSACPYEPAGGVYVKTRRWYFLPDIPGYPYNQGVSMSDNGLALGGASVWDSESNQWINKHWLWDGRRYIFPTYPSEWDVSAFWAGPLFINNKGQIVGQFVDIATGRMRGFLQYGSKLTAFDAPGNPTEGTFVNDMNNAGYAVLAGIYDDDASPYYPSTSFLLREGKFTALPHVPFDDVAWSVVFGVNDRGDMVGRWWDSNNNMHPYVAFRKK